MSWGFVAQKVTPADADTALQKASDDYQASLGASDYDLDASAKEQIATALTVAKTLITSGVVGNAEFYVTLNGHANPGHVPKLGWANDTITVAVTSTEALPAQ